MTQPSLRKRLEIWGRHQLATLVDLLLFQYPRSPLVDDELRRVLVVRFDRRVGNLLLLTPMLAALKRRLPDCDIDMVVHADMARVVHAHPALARIFPFRKWALLSSCVL